MGAVHTAIVPLQSRLFPTFPNTWQQHFREKEFALAHRSGDTGRRGEGVEVGTRCTELRPEARRANKVL